MKGHGQLATLPYCWDPSMLTKLHSSPLSLLNPSVASIVLERERDHNQLNDNDTQHTYDSDWSTIAVSTHNRIAEYRPRRQPTTTDNN